MLDKGAKNQVWFLPPIDTEGLKPHYKRQHPVKRIITHCPSRSSSKGTAQFNKLMKGLAKEPKLRGKFIYKQASSALWEDNITRMSECDIYFDACCPTLKGKPYGEWGIAALEACCLGKVVVSHFLNVDRYRKECGIGCAIRHANTWDAVAKQMRRLILMSNDKFKALQKTTRKWVEENHSYEVVGKKLVDIYNKHLTWEGK
jgi:hypothetical protein